LVQADVIKRINLVAQEQYKGLYNSNEKYELSVYPSSNFTGKPEDAFAASAVYLNNH
jgi:hypothetical protein